MQVDNYECEICQYREDCQCQKEDTHEVVEDTHEVVEDDMEEDDEITDYMSFIFAIIIIFIFVLKIKYVISMCDENGCVPFLKKQIEL